MKIVSVNVGLPREVIWKGKRVTTGILKEPITGRVMMRRLNLDGDRQADLSVHGGPSKAVYVYPVEHYDYWRGELPEMKLPWHVRRKSHHRRIARGCGQHWGSASHRFSGSDGD